MEYIWAEPIAEQNASTSICDVDQGIRNMGNNPDLFRKHFNKFKENSGKTDSIYKEISYKLFYYILYIINKEMKEVLIVSIGSFFGGGMRYWISKLVQSCTVIAFPFGTMAVNVAGCLIIGFLSGLNWREGGWMSPSAKLLLTTGFCGGFTTFSTFMNEGAGLMKEENYLYMMLYLFGSLALGLIAVLAGHYLAKIIA